MNRYDEINMKAVISPLQYLHKVNHGLEKSTISPLKMKVSLSKIPPLRAGKTHCNLLLVRFWVSFTSPVIFDSNQNFLWIKGPTFMVHNLAVPSHSICYTLNLHKDLYRIPEYGCPFWPQNSINL